MVLTLSRQCCVWGEQKTVVSVVDDQTGCPTNAIDLARALIEICIKLGNDKSYNKFGVFNLVNSGTTSWFGLAEQVFAKSAQFGGPVVQVEPINSDKYPSQAPRPKNSHLSLDKIGKIYGIKMRDWHEAIDDCVAQIKLTARN